MKGRLSLLKGTQGVWPLLDPGGCEVKILKQCDHLSVEQARKGGEERGQGGRKEKWVGDIGEMESGAELSG